MFFQEIVLHNKKCPDSKNNQSHYQEKMFQNNGLEISYEVEKNLFLFNELLPSKS